MTAEHKVPRRQNIPSKSLSSAYNWVGGKKRSEWVRVDGEADGEVMEASVDEKMN